jgi:phosphinothricin acetyltransferase
MIKVRSAGPSDIPAIAAIYKHYVENSTCTLELKAPSESNMLDRFMRITGGDYPFLVASRAGEVLGYAYAASFRTRPAFHLTVEDTIYVRHDSVRQGIGAQLLARIVEDCQQNGFQQLIATLSGDDIEPSFALHAKLGFTQAGRLHQVAYKFGRYLDLTLLQRSL